MPKGPHDSTLKARRNVLHVTTLTILDVSSPASSSRLRRGLRSTLNPFRSPSRLSGTRDVNMRFCGSCYPSLEQVPFLKWPDQDPAGREALYALISAPAFS